MEEEINATIEAEIKKLPNRLDLLFGFEKIKRKRRIELDERLMDNLIEKLLLEEKRLEEINDKIMRNRILEKLCIEEINKEMFNQAKLLEETEEKLFRMEYRITKAIHSDCQEELLLLEKKLDTQRVESKIKIKEYETKIDFIRDESKIEIEDINTEKINKLIKTKTKKKENMKKTRIRITTYKEKLIA